EETREDQKYSAHRVPTFAPTLRSAPLQTPVAHGHSQLLIIVIYVTFCNCYTHSRAAACRTSADSLSRAPHTAVDRALQLHYDERGRVVSNLRLLNCHGYYDTSRRPLAAALLCTAPLGCYVLARMFTH